MLFYQERIQDLYRRLETSEQGLSNHEAAARLKSHGRNEIVVKGEPWWHQVVEPFRNVFMLVLLGAAVLSLTTGHLTDGIIVMVIVGVSAVIFYVQNYSTSRVLKALRQYNKQLVEVWRGGEAISVASEELVPGDVVGCHEGDKVPADLRLVRADTLRCDESMLTGESLPTTKQLHPLTGEHQPFEQSNMLFQGSFIVSGDSLGVVVATGNQTEFGRLATLAEGERMTSPVQAKINRLVTQLMLAAIGLAAIVLALELFRGISPSEAIRFALSLTVSLVPEDLPVALSIILVLGVRRMAKRHALVRNMQAIEDLGMVTVIATDKTGTLTKNQLAVHQIWQPEGAGRRVVAAGLAALAANQTDGRTHDPLDHALLEAAERMRGKIPKSYRLHASLPFEQTAAMSGNVWRAGQGFEIVIKGAPEGIFKLSRLSGQALSAAETAFEHLTSQGWRVLALTHTSTRREVAKLHELPKTGWEFDGLLAVADELRPEAAAAIKTARQAGIEVIMITGDHRNTAYTIGKHLGLVTTPNQVLDSSQADSMPESGLRRALQTVRVFARVTPETKFRLLGALKKREIAAMTGDGVNDVPALRNAHVGIAMGSGSALAREAGDIVLLDNNFKSIVEAIREGRAIVSNIRRMLFYLLSTSAGEVLTMIGALVLGLPLPVAAVQILWINLVTDTALVIPLGLEPAERHAMKTPPRDPKAPILDPVMIVRMVLVAAVMASAALATFHYLLQNHTTEYARTVTFSVLVVCQWANALNARAEVASAFSRLRVPNKSLAFGLSAALVMQILALTILAPLLHLVPVAWTDVVLYSALGAVAVIAVSELHKLTVRR